MGKALKSATEKHVADMFIEMLPFVFVQPRHQYQEGVLDMMSSILTEHETHLRSQVTLHEGFVAGADQEKANREQAITDAEAAVAAKVEELQAANSTLETCKSELDSAKASLSAAEKERDATASKNSEAGANKETLELALEVKQKLDAGIEDDTERQREANQLHKLLSPILEDKNMLNAMQLSFCKTKEKLEAFDTMVITCVDAEMKKSQEAVKTILAETDTSQKAADDKVTACQASVDQCAEALTKAKEGVSQAKSAKHETDVSLKTAKSKLNALKGEVKESKANLENSTQTLSEFVDGALSNFNELRHGPKVEEKQDVVEEPAAQEASTDAAMEPPQEFPKEDIEKPQEVAPTTA